jgi:hypothetical protein
VGDGVETLGLKLGKPFLAPGYFFEDSIDASCPDEGFGVRVPGGKELIDGRLKITHAVERSYPRAARLVGVSNPRESIAQDGQSPTPSA